MLATVGRRLMSVGREPVGPRRDRQVSSPAQDRREQRFPAASAAGSPSNEGSADPANGLLTGRIGGAAAYPWGAPTAEHSDLPGSAAKASWGRLYRTHRGGYKVSCDPACP